MNWTTTTTNTEARSRVAGRRAINKARQLKALDNQQIALNLLDLGVSRPDIAVLLSVGRVTIWRYLNLDLRHPENWVSRIKRAHSISYDGQRPLGRRWRVKALK